MDEIKIHTDITTEIKGVNLNSATGPYMVVAFNNDHTTFESVVSMMRSSCGYDLDTATNYTRKIHFEGQAAIFWGTQDACGMVAKDFGVIKVKCEVVENA